MQQSQGTIAVVGSGPVGSVLSIMLAHEGYQVEIFEKRADPTLGNTPAGRSVNLALTRRAIRAFEMIGAKDRVLSHAIAMFGRTSHNKDGNYYHQYGKENDCNYSISRNLLNNVLIEAAKEEKNINYHFNQQLISFDVNETSLTFANQEGQPVTYKFDEVFAADGAFSAIRRQFIFSQDFNYNQEFSDYGYLEFEVPSTPEGDFAMHVNSFHLWPRMKSVLLGMPNTNKTFTCNLFMPLKGPDSFESLAKEEDFADYMHRQFPDVAHLMTDLLDTIRTGPRGRLQDIKCYPWVVKNFCLIGDAAHAIFPFYGQGLNAGLEDCTTLIDLVKKNKDNWPLITSQYQVARKINTDAISDLSKQNFVELRDKMADKDFLLKKHIISYLSDNYDDIYLSQYSMIAFSLTEYHKANAFGKVEDQIIAEIKRIPNYKEMIETKKRYPEIESILKSYQGIYELSKDQAQTVQQSSYEQVTLPDLGSFELDKPILCSRGLNFEGHNEDQSFSCFDPVLPQKENPYPQYDKLQVEKLTICPHLHTTHAETECHIKSKDGQNIMQKAANFLDQYPTLCIEVTPEDTQLEVSLQQLKTQYLLALGKAPSSQLREFNRIYKVAIVKFIYNEKPNPSVTKITNWPYLSTEGVQFLREKGCQVIAMNTPSFDAETSSNLDNHHGFFDGTHDNLVIELLDTSRVTAGVYFADIGIYPIDSDAAPCTLKLKKIVSARLNERSLEGMQ